MSEFLPEVGTGIPDSAGDFPSRVVRSVPLLPIGHSAIYDGARFLSRLNTVAVVVSIVLSITTSRILNVPAELCEQVMMALYPCPTHSLRSLLEDGGLAPVFS